MKKLCLISCLILWSSFIFAQTIQTPNNVSVTNDGFNPVTIDLINGKYAFDVNILTGNTTSFPIKTTVSSSFTYNQVAVSNTATLIKGANALRTSITIRNIGAVDEYIGDASVTTSTGMLLHTNDVLIDDRSTAAWYGITSGSTTTTAWVEE